ncbi:MAG: flagellar FlbD family protein [bacterium]|nr:flagellar FlbD family protein [bacterium]
MIPVAPIAGGTILLNADLIEAIESDPDTVIVLANGRRMVVTDDPQTLVHHISRARAAVLAAAQDVAPRGNATVVPLRPAKGQS